MRFYVLNDEARVHAVTQRAISASPERRAELLDGRLEGVSIRTASALLAVVDPAVHTILDFRAIASLQALQTTAGEAAIDNLPVSHWDRHYWIYNERCRARGCQIIGVTELA